MADKYDPRGKSPRKKKIFFLLFSAGAVLFPAAFEAQTPTPSPTPADETATFRGYDVKSSFEVGVRGVDVNGNINKYRSDFNYKSGVRVFDSSFLMEDEENKRGFFDSLLVTSSGWNSDPSGFTRVNIEKTGVYRFDTKIRQVVYFNNLNNHTRNARTADTRHDFGDFDLTVFPQSERLRLRFGTSYNRTNGSGGYTTRAYSDEYPIAANVDNGANDFRAGLDSKLLGFNWSLSYGYRQFKDNAYYSILAPNPGFNTTNNPRLATFERFHPTEGDTHYALFNVQRTFAKKLDFTARVIYSITDRNFGFTETITGRDNSNNIVDLDRFDIRGDSKRPQTRGDLGLTYAVTRKLRISESFSFDTFNITGGNSFAEALFTRTAAGGPRATVFTNNFSYRLTSFQRFVNTLEADYQFNDRFGFNIGYRYTRRKIALSGFTQPQPPATNLTRSLFGPEEEENQTNALIAGLKAKPLKNWTLFADIETGDADNAFTRLANYKFTNLRLRSRWSFNRFAFNISAITKDNENPSTSTAPQGNVTGDFIANIKSRIFSGYVDWTPVPKFSLSAGYTYHRLTSETDIVINVGTLTRGLSRYYMRDHYAFFDVSAQPFKRVSFFASYRLSDDRGQGDRISTAPQILISSYPFKLHAPEARVAIKLTRNVDWNIGYQYLEYTERFQPLSVGGPQDYHANLPYTSLRIYFGGRGER